MNEKEGFFKKLIQNFERKKVKYVFLRGQGFIKNNKGYGEIDILVKNWIAQFKYLENIIFTVNHESLHVVVDRILLEDGFNWFGDYDAEYPFYAGGIDSMLGQSSSQNALQWFLGDNEAKNTVKKFSDEYCKIFEDGDYDL